ncbi:MAG: hypothetical protein O6762_02360 [Thaumarchaeota archaeon]|nr:hypothetical protein [Nitrososphaerota archaeon]
MRLIYLTLVSVLLVSIVIASLYANISVAFYNQQTSRWGPSNIIGLDRKLDLLDQEGFQAEVTYRPMVYKVDLIDSGGTELKGVWTLDLAQLAGVLLVIVGGIFLKERITKRGNKS